MHDPDKNPPSPRESHLASQARRDARRRGPGFSEELHGRIIQAVKQAGPASRAQSEVVPHTTDDDGSFRTGPAISAVLVAAVALVVLSRFHFEQPVLPVKVATHTTLPSEEQKLWPVMQTIEVVPARVQTAVVSAVEEEQFAGLDQDARHMTRYLAKQVPFQNKWNNP